MGRFEYRGELHVHRRRLPHWDIDDGIFFATFVLKDAAARHKLAELRLEYEKQRARLDAKRADAEAYEALSEEYFVEDLEPVLDAGYGRCELKDPRVAQCLWDSIHHFDGLRYDIVAATVMPNHVHVVFRKLDQGQTCTGIVGSWKSFTYNAVRKQLDIRIEWQDECFDRLIRSSDELRRTMQYVLDNPVRAKLRDWPWVNANGEWLVGL